MRKFILGAVVTLAVLAIIGLVGIWSGFINTDADQTPSGLEAWLAHETVQASIKKRAIQVNNPLQITDAMLIEGMKTYLMACAECHGGADKKPSVFGAALYPPAPQFVIRPLSDPEWQIFYATKHGFRNTGMPAWKGLMVDDDIWKMAAFLSRVEKLPATVQAEWSNAGH